MRVLLTGAFGIVGQSALIELLQRHWNVRIFELPTKRNRKLYHWFQKHYPTTHLEIFWGDLRNYDDIKAAIHGIETIIHLGAIIPPLADKKPQLAESVNVGGTQHIIKALETYNPTCKLIYSSSIAVYGDRRDNFMINESDPFNPSPHDEYAKQKIRAEELIKASSLTWTILRLTYITSMDKLQLDPLMYEMPLDTHIEICQTQDVGLALSNACQSTEIWGQILNIGGGFQCRTTYRDYLKKMMQLFGIGKELPSEAFSTEAFHCGWLNTEKSQKLLHYQRTSLDEYYNQVKKKVWWKRPFISLAQPIARLWLLNRSKHYQAAHPHN